ncbi:MAG: sigma-70 family RNA polymerase sigma factor [Candidatus Latescibacterota bacterium]
MIGRFRRLCARHQDRVFTFARYYLGQREDAEDVTQEVLVRLWEHGAQIPEEELPAWLATVRRNACLDLLRRRRSERAVVSSSGGCEPLERAVAPGPQPDGLVQDAELRAQLEGGLQLLPEAQRAVVVLREVQGMTYEQISQALGLPLNTVKVYLHRGRRALRGYLGEHVP